MRRLPITFDHDGQQPVAELSLPAGEYSGYSEELGIQLGDEIQWGRPEYHLQWAGADTNVTSDVVMGRITVRDAQTDAVMH